MGKEKEIKERGLNIHQAVPNGHDLRLVLYLASRRGVSMLPEAWRLTTELLKRTTEDFVCKQLMGPISKD